MIQKYRAYWVSENKMLTHVQELCFDWDGNFETVETEHYECLHADQVILMQSTGLFSTCYQDELFKDDIISWSYYDEWEDSGKARIVYKDGCWKLCDIKTGKEVWDSLYDCLQNCTVFLISNIHEHPELLEGK